MNEKYLLANMSLNGYFICHAASAAAQGSHRLEVFGSLKDERFGTTFHSGLNLSLSCRRLWSSSVSEKEFSGGVLFPAQYAGNQPHPLYAGDVPYHFVIGRVQPYVLASFEIASYPLLTATFGKQYVDRKEAL